MRPEKPPQFCGHCDTRDGITWHCANPRCRWGACPSCNRLTDLAGMFKEGEGT